MYEIKRMCEGTSKDEKKEREKKASENVPVYKWAGTQENKTEI